jgi:NOL1/NOP2/fmu family ribosome biogenesis protein
MNISDFLKKYGIVLDGEIIYKGKKVHFYSGERIPILGDIQGLYIGTDEEDGFRPSIDLCQLATKNLTEIDEKTAVKWMCGMNIPIDTNEELVLLKHEPYILGGGKVRESNVFNFVPKNRRLPLSHLRN